MSDELWHPTGMKYCPVHHGFAEEDQDECDNWSDDAPECELKVMHYLN